MPPNPWLKGYPYQLFRTTQQLKRFDYGPRPTSLAALAYNGDLNNQTITLSGDAAGSGTTAIPVTVTGLRGRPVSPTAPTPTQVLAWSGSAWTPTAPATGGGGGTPGGASGQVQYNSSGAFAGVTMSGDAAWNTGTGALTLATVNANVGTFQGITVNGKGLVTAAVNQGYLTGNQTVTLSGDISGSGATAITATLPNVNANIGTFQGITVNAKGQVTAATNQGYGVGTLTGVTAGTGLTGGGTSGNPTISLSTPVAVANGGTGAATFVTPPFGGGSVLLSPGGTAALTASGTFAVLDSSGGVYQTVASATARPGYFSAGARGSLASPTATQTGDLLMGLFGSGRGATVWSANNLAGVLAIATQTFTDAAQGTSLNLAATANGSNAQATRVIIQSGVQVGVPTGGDLGVGTLNATGLYINNTAVLTGNQTITLSGDAAGSGTTAIPVTLANTAVTPAAYTHSAITVDSKGRLTAAANGTFTGDATLSGNAITLNTVTVAKGGTGLTAGISGGIPYYSSTSAMTSSALLAAGQVVAGGGAGAAPATLANGQLPATATNDSAASGKVGEVISSNIPFGSPTALATGVTRNLTSITLTAGDWDVDGNFYTTTGPGTALTDMYAGLTLTSNGLPSDNSYLVRWQGSVTNPNIGIVVPMQRFSLAGTTTIYLTISPAFTVSTLGACGNLRARRAR